jgi:hypothetical protein
MSGLAGRLAASLWASRSIRSRFPHYNCGGLKSVYAYIGLSDHCKVQA